VSAAVARSNIGEIRSDQGRFEEAETYFQRSGSVFTASGYAIATGFVLANRGRVAARRGAHDEAQRLYESALATFGRIDAIDFEQETRARVAELALFQGNTDEAVALLDDLRGGLELHTPTGSLVARLRGVALCRGGRHDDGVAELRLARAAADASGATYERALVDVALTWALPEDGSESQIHDATETLARLGIAVDPLVLVLGQGQAGFTA
jgi:tetratricopeptide (TPR) repeat protein